ncbi:MAG TPA: phosphoribosylformylglycinamidine synthase, partial [Patescibacteria group bacterium]|nr:phosphoribosylformylglycinamidine synthase [Patescibacteria group bacterium]
MILRFGGVAAISDFRASKLLGQIQEAEPAITAISGEYLHFVSPTEKLTSKQTKILESLLTYDIPYKGSRRGELILVVPRRGTISPWSSKATSIALNSGLPINRIERGIAYYLKTTSSFDQGKISNLLHDRMTETILSSLEATDALFESSKPKSLKYIDIKSGHITALKEADKKMGLALSEEEIGYLYSQYKKLDRNPTDLELMMFGVVNSEHCRHKIFNADWYIDGKKQPKSLFKMIKNTYEHHSENIISAYSDNSAVLKGNREKQLLINQSDGSYDEKIEESNIVIKVETHNHPTAIAPFPGAATGSGGEIRDENATGRGAKPKMGLTGFNVSNLQIPGFVQPWETTPERPDRIASPLEIMIKAPLGGASFNNEFGRPNVVGYFRTYEEKSSQNSSEKWGYHKPIMIAGGLGSIRSVNEDKQKLPVGAKLVVIGGPSMLIGLAGGSASSMESGKSDSELDFASVQRGNAEIQRRAHEVIASCASLGQANPIISIHDVGAGGLSNALTELVNDSGLGATFELRDIDCADPSLSPMEIWCNESQERYVMAINDEDLETFKDICKKERCPYSIVGETTERQQLVINDSLLGDRPADIPLSLLFGGPPKITKKVMSGRYQSGMHINETVDINEAAERLLRIPSVGSKKFLITIGDRSVGGLIARDQMVGPWQVPVSNCGVSAASFEGRGGEAMAMGERSPLAIIDAPASARMAI